jgi:hypothetical protein
MAVRKLCLFHIGSGYVEILTVAVVVVYLKRPRPVPGGDA